MAKSEGWVAKLELCVAKLVARLLARAAHGLESGHPSKIINGRHKHT